MQLQKQGPLECQLAVLAMLLDRPLDEIRTNACRISGLMRWSDYYGTGHFWLYLRQLWVFYRLPMNNFNVLRHTCTIGTISGIGKIPTGRGQLVLRISASRSLHAVAYENGVIYDPMEDEPIAWKDYFAVHPSFKINTIIPFGEAQNEPQQKSNP